MEHYLDFFALILNHKDNNDDDNFLVMAEYEFLSEPTRDLKKYNQNIEFKKLPLKSNTYHCILSMCKSAIVIGVQSFPNIFEAAGKQVMSILSETNQLPIQIIALDFLNTLLENSSDGFENLNMASYLCEALKSMGDNIQKYNTLDIVKENDLKHFMNVHRSFYTNKFWENEPLRNLSEVLAIAVADSLNAFYENKDIDYVFEFISKLSDFYGQSAIPLHRLKQFHDQCSAKANHLVVQHLALSLENSEDLFKESLKILNFNFKGEDLDGYLEKVFLFKMVKEVFTNFQQRRDFKLKGTLITQKSYVFPADLFFGSYELFVLKFISLAKASKEYAKVLQVFSVILEEEKFYQFLFPGEIFNSKLYFNLLLDILKQSNSFSKV